MNVNSKQREAFVQLRGTTRMGYGAGYGPYTRVRMDGRVRMFCIAPRRLVSVKTKKRVHCSPAVKRKTAFCNTLSGVPVRDRYSVLINGEALIQKHVIAASRNRLAIMTAEDSSSQQTQPGAPGEANSGSPQHEKKSVDTIYLVLDCIIDLGLGDKGLGNRD